MTLLVRNILIAGLQKSLRPKDRTSSYKAFKSTRQSDLFGWKIGGREGFVKNVCPKNRTLFKSTSQNKEL